MTDMVLCVDDDANLLEGLKRQLRKQFTLETALSGEDGLAVLKEQGPLAVVVSDMRMPGMNGARFLAQVRELAPDTVRILLTGQADIQDAIVAVNEGNIFRFLTKPCPPEVLSNALQAALQQYHLITAERTLLEQTLRGSVKVLTDVLGLINPVAFGRATRLKRYVLHIARHLDLSDVWRFELAAMLCQLGCVTLPPEILEKVHAGQPLTVEEQRMYANHPAVSHELIRHIPRLEVVAEMIAHQQESYTNDEASHTAQERDQILLGAHILKVVLDFDRLMLRGMSHHDAVVDLLQHADAYGIVAALQDMELEEAEAVAQLVTVRDLYPGMVLDENIRAKTGLLVIAKGHEVTYAMMERLRSYAKRVPLVEPFRVLLPPRHVVK
jgi:response regulator RpfG family c-di-GMP phosphodiesterase